MSMPLEQPNIAYIGRWPMDPEEARRRTRLIHVSPEERLHLIHGRDQHILVSLCHSSEYMSLGVLTVPVGGWSEIESHEGEEALQVLAGTLVVRCFEPGEEDDTAKTSHMSHTVRCGERMFIPHGVKHCYKNFGEQPVRAYFAVAPRL